MKWKNVPIPESVVIPLLVGISLYLLFPRSLVPASFVFVALGSALLLGGLLLILWSVKAVGAMEVASPDNLITSGPYAISRNPLYVAWIVIFAALILFSRSLWLLLLFPIVLTLTHFCTIIPEEQGLYEKFGEAYTRYCERVRQYI